MTNELAWWKNQAGREPLLTPAEEITLGTMIREWQDWPGGPDQAPERVQRRGKRAQDRFIRANLRLAINYVINHCQRRLYHHDAEELVSVANFGLIRAVQKFDPTRGYKFSTYSFAWLQQAVGRWTETSSRLIRRPIHHEQTIARIRRIQNDHHALTGQTLKLEDALERLREKSGDTTISRTTMESLQSILIMGMRHCSLDAPTGSTEDHTLADMLSAPEQHQDDDKATLAIERVTAVLQLMQRDHRVIFAAAYGLFGMPVMDKEELAARAGVDGKTITYALNVARSEFRCEIKAAEANGNTICQPFQLQPKGPSRQCSTCDKMHEGVYGDFCPKCWLKHTPEGRARNTAYRRELRRKRRHGHQTPNLEKLIESLQGIAPAWLLAEDLPGQDVKPSAVVDGIGGGQGSDLQFHHAGQRRFQGNGLSSVLPDDVANSGAQDISREFLHLADVPLQLDLCSQTEFSAEPSHAAA